jgi:hypothetical protein
MIKVLEVPVPQASSLLRTLKTVHFSDAYQTKCNPKLNVQDAYEAIFGHSPQWVRSLLTVRGMVASVLGLKHVADADFSRAPGENYQVTQRVGLFSVQSNESNELIVGDNDKHLDFRISIYRSSANGVEIVTVSTVVEIHNAVGRLYMLVVKPFHRLIARSMLQKAANANRL